MYVFCFTGIVGITLNTDWWQPYNYDDPADWEAADRALEFTFGWFKNPVFNNGDYPEVMKEVIKKRSMEAGLNVSRLPEFTEDEKEMIQGIHFVCGDDYRRLFVFRNLTNYFNNHLVKPLLVP